MSMMASIKENHLYRNFSHFWIYTESLIETKNGFSEEASPYFLSWTCVQNFGKYTFFLISESVFSIISIYTLYKIYIIQILYIVISILMVNYLVL